MSVRYTVAIDRWTVDCGGVLFPMCAAVNADSGGTRGRAASEFAALGVVASRFGFAEWRVASDFVQVQLVTVLPVSSSSQSKLNEVSNNTPVVSQ